MSERVRGRGQGKSEKKVKDQLFVYEKLKLPADVTPNPI